MRNDLVKWVFIGLIICLISGCSADLEQQAVQGEKQWQNQNITDYEIEVLFVQSIWHAQTHRVIVENGEVVEAAATCTPAPFEGKTCAVEEFNAEDFTVAGLFKTARTQALRSDGKWTTIDFDEQYNFPRRISFDDPEILDEDVSWQVTQFEVKP